MEQVLEWAKQELFVADVVRKGFGDMDSPRFELAGEAEAVAYTWTSPVLIVSTSGTLLLEVIDPVFSKVRAPHGDGSEDFFYTFSCKLRQRGWHTWVHLNPVVSADLIMVAADGSRVDNWKVGLGHVFCHEGDRISFQRKDNVDPRVHSLIARMEMYISGTFFRC